MYTTIDFTPNLGGGGRGEGGGDGYPHFSVFPKADGENMTTEREGREGRREEGKGQEEERGRGKKEREGREGRRKGAGGKEGRVGRKGERTVALYHPFVLPGWTHLALLT